jgi:hypothetical protein
MYQNNCLRSRRILYEVVGSLEDFPMGPRILSHLLLAGFETVAAVD